MKSYIKYILLFLSLLTIYCCALINPEDMQTKYYKDPDPEKPWVNNTTVDSDGDGIYMLYDYDDCSPANPEPYMVPKTEFSEEKGTLFSKAFLTNTNIPLLSRSYFLCFYRTNSYNLGLYETDFKFMNNEFYYRIPGSSGWSYSLNNINNISKISDAAKEFSSALSTGSYNVRLNDTDIFSGSQPLFTNSINDIGFSGKFYMLYNKDIENTAPYSAFADVFDSIGSVLQSGVSRSDFNNLVDKIKNKYNLSDIKTLLGYIRDYFPYGLYAEIYQVRNDIPNDISVEVKFGEQSGYDKPGRPQNCFFPYDQISITSNVNCANSAVSTYIKNNLRYDIYKLGFKRNLPDYEFSFLKSFYKLDEVLNEMGVEYSKTNLSGNTPYQIPADWASDGTWKRFIIMDTWCPAGSVKDGDKTVKSPSFHLIIMLPVFAYGMEVQSSPSLNDGIVKKGEPVFFQDLRGPQLSGRVYYDNNINIYSDYSSSIHPSISVPNNQTGIMQVLLASEYPDSVLPKRTKLRFISISPQITISNQSVITDIIRGDKITCSVSPDPISLIDTNSDGKLDRGVSNCIAVYGNPELRSVSNTFTVSNIIIKSGNLLIKKFLFITAGQRQSANPNFVNIETNLLVASPEFTIAGLPAACTNGETVTASFELPPDQEGLSNKFTNLAVVWTAVSGGTIDPPLVTHYGTDEACGITFSAPGIYTVTATMTYNGEKYEASNNILVGGEIQPVITGVSVDGQDFGISNISTIESNSNYELSFISSNVICLSAAITNAPGLSNEIWWEITAVSNTNLVQHIVTNTPELMITVGKPYHLPYVAGKNKDHPGNGSIFRPLPLSYQIKAYYMLDINQTNSFVVTLKQDERSILRQEYWDHGHLTNVTVAVPDYNIFISNVSSADSPYFTFDEYRTGDPQIPYDWIIVRQALMNGINAVRDAMNTNLGVSSAYRSPVRDEVVANGFYPDNYHIKGLATDIYVDKDFDGNGGINTSFINASSVDSSWTNVADDWARLAATALTNADADWIEPYSVSSNWSYVHMDWRYH